MSYITTYLLEMANEIENMNNLSLANLLSLTSFGFVDDRTAREIIFSEKDESLLKKSISRTPTKIIKMMLTNAFILEAILCDNPTLIDMESSADFGFAAFDIPTAQNLYETLLFEDNKRREQEDISIALSPKETVLLIVLLRNLIKDNLKLVQEIGGKKTESRSDKIFNQLCPRCERKLIKNYAGKQIQIPKSSLHTRNMYLQLAYEIGSTSGNFNSLNEFSEHAREIIKKCIRYMNEKHSTQFKAITADRIVRAVRETEESMLR
jgi:hypothetical protein